MTRLRKMMLEELQRHTGTTSTATKRIRSPVSRHISSAQSSRCFADHFHRETTNTVIVLTHWEKLDNLKFKLEALRYAGQDPETLNRRAAR